MQSQFSVPSTKTFLLLLVFVQSVYSQQFFLGECPTQTVVADLSTSDYLGTWYENRKYFNFFQLFGRCTTAVYTDDGNGLIGVTNSQISLFGITRSVNGQAKFADPSSTEAKLTVSFSSANPFPDPTAETESNYWVLDTDYSSYAIVWSCTDFFFSSNIQYLWVLTREREPDSSVLASALDSLNVRGLNTQKLKVTKQDNC